MYSHICGREAPIDGPSGILGRAGPTWAQIIDDNVTIPRTGIMEFDIIDIQNLIDDGTWARVIEHEM